MDDANILNQVSGIYGLELSYSTTKVAGDATFSCSLTSTLNADYAALYVLVSTLNIGGNLNIQNCGGATMFGEFGEVTIGGDWVNTNISCSYCKLSLLSLSFSLSFFSFLFSSALPFFSLSPYAVLPNNTLFNSGHFSGGRNHCIWQLSGHRFYRNHRLYLLGTQREFDECVWRFHGAEREILRRQCQRCLP